MASGISVPASAHQTRKKSHASSVPPDFRHTASTSKENTMTTTLRIAEIPAGPAGGVIGITLAPGKHQDGALGGNHKRSLSEDLDVIANWGACAVVTLVTAE